MAYKAGMSHVVRDVNRPGSKYHKKEIVDAVTILEAPPMVVVGVVGYVATPSGLRTLTTVWAQHLSIEAQRRFYRNWYTAKKKAFTKYVKKYENNAESIQSELARIAENCDVVRVLAHTQITKLNLRQKKAHICEIQINGGDAAAKVAFAKDLFEKEVKISSVFSQSENLDVCGVTKGHVWKELQPVGELPVYLEKLTVVYVKLHVLVLGIHRVLLSLLLVQVKMVIIIVQKLIKKSTELVKKVKQIHVKQMQMLPLKELLH